MGLKGIVLSRVLDTTLREGEQTPTVYFQPEEKCVIAEMLYKALGRKAFLEVGQPYSPMYREGVEAVVKHFKALSINDANLLSHCRTVKEDVDVAWNCGTKGVTVFMAASEKHLLYKLNRMSYEEALRKIGDIISYAKNKVGFEIVVYTLEDATSLDFEKTIEIGKVAEEAGVDFLKIPDTKGQVDFDNFRALISRLVKEVRIPVDLHCHNDRGLAVANSISGLKAGATGVNAAVLGLGERCGIADLATVVENLETLYGVDTGVDFKVLPRLYEYVSAVSGIPIPPGHPIVGLFAHTHKAGTHQKAVLQAPDTYETIDWSKYGLEREYEFGAMQSKELIDKLLESYTLSAEVKNHIVEAIRDLSMMKGRPLRLPEVWRIIAEETGLSLVSKSTLEGGLGDAVVFLRVRPSCDEQDLIKLIRKEFMKHTIPVRVRDITGDWDFIVDAKGVTSLEQLDEITGHIRKGNKDILETSTSIVFDEYR